MQPSGQEFGIGPLEEIDPDSTSWNLPHTTSKSLGHVLVAIVVFGEANILGMARCVCDDSALSLPTFYQSLAKTFNPIFCGTVTKHVAVLLDDRYIMRPGGIWVAELLISSSPTASSTDIRHISPHLQYEQAH